MKQQLDRCVETRSREVVILVLSVSNTVQIVKAHWGDVICDLGPTCVQCQQNKCEAGGCTVRTQVGGAVTGHCS